MQQTKTTMLCEALFEQLKQVKSPIINLLNDGVSRSEIDNSVKNIDIILPDSVYELFGWRNGLNDALSEGKALGELSLLPLAAFYSIEIAAQAYEYYAMSNSFWKNRLFPIFQSGVGDYYLVDCDSDSRTFKMVWYHSPAQVEFDGWVTKYDSLESLLFTITECFKQKAYFYSRSNMYEFAEGPYFQFDVYKEAHIAKRYNPLSEYWQLFK